MDDASLTPEEAWALVWKLTQEEWLAKTGRMPPEGIRKDVFRIYRNGRLTNYSPCSVDSE
jgi:hypothetical protein